MREFLSTIPDADALLALTPEELGSEILMLLRDRGMMDFHVGFPFQDLQTCDETREGRGYPREMERALDQAFDEAVAWLVTHDLIIPKQSGSGPNGHMRISRLGVEAARQIKKGDHSAALRLRKDMLHSAIAEDVWIEMVRGDFSDAVFKAMRAIEIAVREAAGFPEGDHGVPMIRRAFSPKDGPLRDPSQQEGEREALMHLFAGAIGSYKNPNSHRNVPMDDGAEAIEIVMLASHLLRIVDARKGQGTQP